MSQTQIDGRKQIEAGTVTLGAGGDVTGVLTTTNGGTEVSSPGANGNVLTSNGSVWVSAPTSGAVAVPQRPTAGFTVDANTQVLYSVDLDMQAANGDLTINGILQGVH